MCKGPSLLGRLLGHVWIRQPLVRGWLVISPVCVVTFYYCFCRPSVSAIRPIKVHLLFAIRFARPTASAIRHDTFFFTILFLGLHNFSS